jgi:thiamine kinase-like enzyme
MDMQAGKRHTVHIEFKGNSITNLRKLPKQGFSNENYIFTLNQKNYLLRKFKLQDRNRQLEFKIQTLAHEKDLAAKAYVLNLLQDYMICEFLEGYHKDKLQKEDMELMSNALKKLHSIKLEGKALNIQNLFLSLDETLQNTFEILEHYSKDVVLCHNDLNPRNCIFSENGLKFIDWEFAAMNDRYFDLAGICVEFSLNNSEENYFMNLYFENYKWSKEKLNAYKVIYENLCKQWFEENQNV